MAEEGKVGVKLVVVGDGAVGKTTLLMRYRENKFPTKYVPTVFENYYKAVVHEGIEVNLGLWDTAGQEEYDRLRSLSYHDTDIVLLIFSVDSPTSLDNLSAKWEPEVSHHCEGTPIMVVGTKADLRDNAHTIASLKESDRHPVTVEEGNAKARELDAFAYMECSALSGEGVAEIFSAALQEVLTRKGYLRGGGKKGGFCTLL
jgi:small GTP-binding protein